MKTVLAVTPPLILILAVVPAFAAEGDARTDANKPADEKIDEIEITVTARSTAAASHDEAGVTTVPSKVREPNPAPPNFNAIIGATVPGATTLPAGAIRIRGSDNQFSYCLDGAPLPANVSAFITDQINLKNIEGLHVYTGVFLLWPSCRVFQSPAKPAALCHWATAPFGICVSANP